VRGEGIDARDKDKRRKDELLSKISISTNTMD
jgi:hypothetical protein